MRLCTIMLNVIKARSPLMIGSKTTRRLLLRQSYKCVFDKIPIYTDDEKQHGRSALTSLLVSNKVGALNAAFDPLVTSTDTDIKDNSHCQQNKTDCQYKNPQQVSIWG
jgi:hypothetical protein